MWLKGFFSLIFFCGLNSFIWGLSLFYYNSSHFDSKAEYEVASELQLQCMHTDKDWMNKNTDTLEGDDLGRNFHPLILCHL